MRSRRITNDSNNLDEDMDRKKRGRLAFLSQKEYFGSAFGSQAVLFGFSYLVSCEHIRFCALLVMSHHCLETGVDSSI